MAENDDSYIARTFRFLDSLTAPALPVSLNRCCRAAGVELIPFSRLIGEGFSREELRTWLGNDDGACYGLGDHRVIVFNDGQPDVRSRFTVAEELMHHVLGHPRAAGFSALRQSYSEEEYARIEQEAKGAACLLLCPPGYYLRRRPDLTETMRRCLVSEACAVQIRRFYAEHDIEIRRCFRTSPQNRIVYSAPNKDSPCASRGAGSRMAD